MRLFILKKSIIGEIFSLLVISILLISFSNNNKSIQTMSWATQNKTIVLDAGHGYPDERSIQ